MLFRSVTFETSQSLRGLLKSLALSNMPYMLVTDETSQAERSPVEGGRRRRTFWIHVSHRLRRPIKERSPLKEAGALEHARHVRDAAQVGRVSRPIYHVAGALKGISHAGPVYVAPLLYGGQPEFRR